MPPAWVGVRLHRARASTAGHVHGSRVVHLRVGGKQLHRLDVAAQHLHRCGTDVARSLQQAGLMLMLMLMLWLWLWLGRSWRGA